MISSLFMLNFKFQPKLWFLPIYIMNIVLFFFFWLQWGFRHVFNSKESYDYDMKGMEWKDTSFKFWNREFRNWIAYSEVLRLTMMPLTVNHGATHGQPWFNCGANRRSKIKQENSRTWKLRPVCSRSWS